MKLARLNNGVQSIYFRYILQNGYGLGVSSYSTTSTSTATLKSSPRSPEETLYSRLTPVVDSVVPVLDQWIKEGGTVDRQQLHCIINEMRRYKRFKHALEISMWMRDKRYYTLSSRDNAIRLELISIVHGIEEAEKYFDDIPERSRFLEIYSALLKCYARKKSVEKAEAVMQKMRDLGFAWTTSCYNVMLNFYYRTGNNEKVDSLMDEMEAKGIECDRFTFGIRLSAYAAASDIVGMDKILLRMESSSSGILDWTSCACAASGYLRSGLVDKALEMLHKSEGLIATAKERTNAYGFLITQYAATGRKDEALRIWELYKKEGMLDNMGYISMLTTLLKFDDIEGAEKLFGEWESMKLSYDIRVPNFLLGAYCRKGLLEKAENLINNILSKGNKLPDAYTWYYLATGYFQDNQTSKAVETMRKALLVCAKRWRPRTRNDTISACLKYLKKMGDLEGAEEFIRLLKIKEIVPTDICDRLLDIFNDEESNGLQSIDFRSILQNRNGLGFSSYSTSTSTATLKSSPRSSEEILYRRLTPVVDSVVPVLDQWIEGGGTVDSRQLHCIIKKMRHYKRFKHALEISMWMSGKRYYPLTNRDNAIRLDLISKVHGIEEAEKYFDNIPERSRFLEVYGALLNCYVQEKSVEKAEAVMQKMRDLGFARTSLCYNVMLNLYCRTGNNEKVDSLMDEMEAKGIECDRFTFSIRLSAYAAASDIVGMDKILLRMETSSSDILDWISYACVASGYLRSGLVDKALEMLHKSEGLIATAKERTNAYGFLLTQYAATGRKDEALRIWELYKKEGMVYNKGYISMLNTLLKFDDLEGAEKLFEEWESQKLSYDIRVTNFLLGAYCRKGLLEKAENLINNILSKGKMSPDAYTWYYLATAYLQDNQTSKAVETMRKALLVCAKRWKPSIDAISACLKYLKKMGDLEGAEEFIRLLKIKEIIPTDVCDRLLDCSNDEESNLDSFIQMEEDDASAGDGETSKFSGIELDRSNFEASKGDNI